MGQIGNNGFGRMKGVLLPMVILLAVAVLSSICIYRQMFTWQIQRIHISFLRRGSSCRPGFTNETVDYECLHGDLCLESAIRENQPYAPLREGPPIRLPNPCLIWYISSSARGPSKSIFNTSPSNHSTGNNEIVRDGYSCRSMYFVSKYLPGVIPSIQLRESPQGISRTKSSHRSQLGNVTPAAVTLSEGHSHKEPPGMETHLNLNLNLNLNPSLNLSGEVPKNKSGLNGAAPGFLAMERIWTSMKDKEIDLIYVDVPMSSARLILLKLKVRGLLPHVNLVKVRCYQGTRQSYCPENEKGDNLLVQLLNETHRVIRSPVHTKWLRWKKAGNKTVLDLEIVREAANHLKEGFMPTRVIPKIFHFVWVSSQLPPGPNKPPEYVMENVKSWAKLNPGWRVKVWNNDDVIREFPEILTILRKVSTVAHAADILRYGVVWRYGGVYLDSDTVALRSIEPIVRSLTLFGICEVPWESPPEISPDSLFISNCNMLANGMIGAVIGHAVLEKAFKSAVSRVQADLARWQSSPPNELTGPALWTSVVLKTKISIFHSWVFLPCHYSNTEKCVISYFQRIPHVYGMHTWVKSWGK